MLSTEDIEILTEEMEKLTPKQIREYIAAEAKSDDAILEIRDRVTEMLKEGYQPQDIVNIMANNIACAATENVFNGMDQTHPKSTLTATISQQQNLDLSQETGRGTE